MLVVDLGIGMDVITMIINDIFLFFSFVSFAFSFLEFMFMFLEFMCTRLRWMCCGGGLACYVEGTNVVKKW